MFRIDVEPESPKEGARLRIWGSRIAKRQGVFKIDVEPESPNEGACLRYTIGRNRQMSGRV